MQTSRLASVTSAHPPRVGGSAAALLALCLALSACSGGKATATDNGAAATEANAPTGTVGPNTLNVADAAIAAGDPSMALSVSQSILNSDPNNVDALVHEGDAYYALQRCPAAMAAFQRALQVDAHSAVAETGLGRCLLKTDPAAAEAAFEQAVQADPGNGAALNDLGIARDLQGNFAGAIDPFQKSLLANPSDSSTEVNLGLSLALSGHGPEALQYLGPLANSQGATPKIREDYAAALVASGRDDEARQVLAVDLTADQVDKAMDGFSTLIAAAIENPPPPPPEPTMAEVTPPAPVSAAPLTPSAPMRNDGKPVPLTQVADVTPPAAATPAPAPAAPSGGATAMAPDTIAIPQPAPPPAPTVPVVPTTAEIAAHQAPVAPVATPVVAPVAPTPAPETAPAAPVDGRVQVQLGAYGSESEASHAWDRISGDASSLLTGKSPTYETATVHGKTYVRLRVGGFTGKLDAAKFCAELSAAGSACTLANF